MRALAPALASLALAASCAVCQRSTDADGRYQATSDCSGQLVQGTLTIGAFGQSLTGITTASSCSGPGDAGTASDCQPVLEVDSECADTAAEGADALGLPSQVLVNGPGDFELYGEVAGRSLTCSPESFGDEVILLCREADRLVCAAALALP